jgi:hypothetical protein
MSNNNPENNDTGAGASESDEPAKEKSGRGLQGLLWVAIVLLVGAIVGTVSFLLIAPHIVVVGGPPPFVGTSAVSDLFTLIAEHIILSTVSIALLVSLVVVYGRIYKQTKANFALGIFIVLLALLLDEILDYPILQLFIHGISPSQLHYSLPAVGDAFTIVAYSVFLYLSLQ